MEGGSCAAGPLIFPCEYCKKAGATSVCARCKGARFCGRECQKAGWKAHKLKCQPIANTKAALSAMEARLVADVAAVEEAAANRQQIVLAGAVAADRECNAAKCAGGAAPVLSSAAVMSAVEVLGGKDNYNATLAAENMAYFANAEAASAAVEKRMSVLNEAVFTLCNTFKGVDEAALLALLRQGAGTEHRDAVFNSALHVCAINGSLGATRLLLAAGADVCAQDSDGLTPLRVADSGPHTLIAHLLRAHKAPWFGDLRYVGPGME